MHKSVIYTEISLFFIWWIISFIDVFCLFKIAARMNVGFPHLKVHPLGLANQSVHTPPTATFLPGANTRHLPLVSTPHQVSAPHLVRMPPAVCWVRRKTWSLLWGPNQKHCQNPSVATAGRLVITGNGSIVQDIIHKRNVFEERYGNFRIERYTILKFTKLCIFKPLSYMWPWLWKEKENQNM